MIECFVGEKPSAEKIEELARRMDPGAWLPVMFTTRDANLRRNCQKRREISKEHALKRLINHVRGVAA